MSDNAYDNLMESIDPVADARIDKYHLDAEARTLPTIMHRYTEIIHKYLTPELNEARFQLEKEEAVARRDIRLKASAEGRKITKDEVDQELACMASIVRLRKQVKSCETDIAYYKSMLTVMDAKRSSLNNLVSLYIKDYYAHNADDGAYAHADVAYSRTEGNDYERYSTKQNKKLNEAMKARRKDK